MRLSLLLLLSMGIGLYAQASKPVAPITAQPSPPDAGPKFAPLTETQQLKAENLSLKQAVLDSQRAMLDREREDLVREQNAFMTETCKSAGIELMACRIDLPSKTVREVAAFRPEPKIDSKIEPKPDSKIEPSKAAPAKPEPAKPKP